MSTCGVLDSTIHELLAPGKGLLAVDESGPTIEKRFAAIGIASTESTRQSYREMLITTARLNEFISGIILYDETLRHNIDGISIPYVISRQGIIPGIKVDKGTVTLPHLSGERITQGLDGLRCRLSEYNRLGARFTKWRSVFSVGAVTPSHACMEANAHALAIFAGMSQEIGLVPIVEPEVLIDGNHTNTRCEEVTNLVLRCVFNALSDHHVSLEHMLLKTGMVLSGSECTEQVTMDVVADSTRRILRNTVPSAVPGILFLSGGQSDRMATQRLNDICHLGSLPWKLSFSFGRALQDEALKVWSGSPDNISAAQAALHHRSYCNSTAINGIYSSSFEMKSKAEFLCHQ